MSDSRSDNTILPYLTPKRAIYIHFIICSFGLIGLSKYLSTVAGALILPSSEPVMINEYLADFFYYPGKRYELFQYVLLVVLLAVYYIIAHVISIKREVNRYADPIIKDLKNTFFAAAIIVSANIILLNPHNTDNPRRFIYGSIVWLFALLLPFLVKFDVNPYRKITRFYYLVCFYCSLRIILLFFPFVFQEPKMINEFLDIPEETFIDQKIMDKSSLQQMSESASVNNTAFIKERNVFGNHRKDNATIDLVLESAAPGKTDDSVKQQFLNKNKFEIHWQILNRWVIHHHNFILGPINEYAFGKNISDIYIQYGWLNVMLTKKILDWTGGINYQNYFKVWYSYYYLYYALFLIGIVLLLKDIKYITIAFLFLSYLLHKIGFNYLFLGPGLNPIRHFFDIISIGLLFLYLEKDKPTFYYFLLLISVVGVLNNSQLGLFSLASILAVLAVYIVNEKKFSFSLIVPAVMAGCAGLIIAGFAGGKNVFTKYYLAGLLGFPFPDKYMIVIGLAVSLGFAFLPKMMRINDNLKYIALYLFFYSQALLIYYVWGATENHFLNFAPIYALTLVVFLKIIFTQNEFLKVRENIIIGGFIIGLLIPFNSSVKKYRSEKSDYEKIFDVHKTYTWNFDRAKFTSTMDPKYFADAVSLIQSHADQNSIYIISKYDTILPFLAKKFSAMPFFDVSNFLITPHEIDLCITAVHTSKPRYLFVDTDINKNLNADIISEDAPVLGYLHDESVWRVKRLNLLKDIFYRVSEDYRLIQKGDLLSVYERKKNEN